ncbi:MAG: UDP-N-acetyl glucosamine 2-epimerase [Prevotella sp.]|jgi:UDP-N-acetylglucosamine 2-epimerase (non-hydrolysing)
MNICIVAGARPNFIKVAPLIRAIERYQAQGNQKQLHYELVYSGREDDPTVEDSLFTDLKIKKPTTYLGVDCENLNVLMGEVMAKFEHHLHEHPTDVVVVVDDLSSTMGVAIVTKKQGLTLAHIAAGTRSFDINMPKEINRLVIDGLSDILFTAGISNNTIANREGAELSKVYRVGNILIDNLRFLHTTFKRPAMMDTYGLKENNYIVFTLNRKKLIDNQQNMHEMVAAVGEALKDSKIPVVAPLRGKAAEAIKNALSHVDLDMRLVEPLSYLDFMYLTSHAKGIITDSGNVAEEATFNGIPCITLNSYTEHIETVKVGTNVLVGEDPEKLRKAVSDMAAGKWKSAGIPDRWDGRSADRVLSILLELKKS